MNINIILMSPIFYTSDGIFYINLNQILDTLNFFKQFQDKHYHIHIILLHLLIINKFYTNIIYYIS